MRWSYKTVHFELKKEGLLGSAFLDEPEIELSLNQYGKAGWELVSLLETLDGLIAVFKQPLELDTRPSLAPADYREGPAPALRPGPASLARKVQARSFAPQAGGKKEPSTLNDDPVEAMVLDEFEVVEDQAEEAAAKASVRSEAPVPSEDIGLIRIE